MRYLLIFLLFAVTLPLQSQSVSEENPIAFGYIRHAGNLAIAETNGEGDLQQGIHSEIGFFYKISDRSDFVPVYLGPSLSYFSLYERGVQKTRTIGTKILFGDHQYYYGGFDVRYCWDYKQFMYGIEANAVILANPFNSRAYIDIGGEISRVGTKTVISPSITFRYHVNRKGNQ